MAEEIPSFLKTEEERDFHQRSRSGGDFRSEKREWGWLILVGIFLAALAAGVWGWQQRQSGSASVTPTPSSIILFTSPPLFSPTPVPSLVPKTSYEIKILNGSGRVGEAGAVKKLLEDQGYKVGEVANASSYDYTSTVIQSLPSVNKTFIEELANVLKKEFDKVTTESKEDLAGEVAIITGGNRVGITATPTATPRSTPEPEATQSAE